MGNIKTELVNLEKTLPDLIRVIKVYTGMDNDFDKLCCDYEELTNSIIYIKERGDGNHRTIKNQLVQYEQLQSELLIEIINFISEEQKQN
jgi:hypothetical protein